MNAALEKTERNHFRSNPLNKKGRENLGMSCSVSVEVSAEAEESEFSKIGALANSIKMTHFQFI